MPAAIQAKGLAPDEPARRTVADPAFCSWSARSIKMRSRPRARPGLPLSSSQRTPQHPLSTVAP